MLSDLTLVPMRLELFPFASGEGEIDKSCPWRQRYETGCLSIFPCNTRAGTEISKAAKLYRICRYIFHTTYGTASV